MSTSKADAAVEYFKREYNCSQSICAAFGEELGLSRESCLALGAPFGAGMAREGEVCGAISGALMILGLQHWQDSPEVVASKERVYVPVLELFSRIKAAHGTLLCREILGQGLRTPEQMKAAKEKQLFRTVCAPLVREVAQLLEEMEHQRARRQ